MYQLARNVRSSQSLRSLAWNAANAGCAALQAIWMAFWQGVWLARDIERHLAMHEAQLRALGLTRQTVVATLHERQKGSRRCWAGR